MNILATCRDRLLTSRNKAISEAESRSALLRSKVPGLSAVDREIMSVPMKLMTAAKGENFGQTAAVIRAKTEELQKKRAEMITSAGFPADYDKPHFSCEKCGDKGYVGYDMCDCLRRMIAEESYNRSGLGNALSECTFDNFFTYYYPSDPAGAEKSPRDVMEAVKNRCRKYAEEFGRDSGNLLFMGGTGLGKTHLSAAIGSTVIKKGKTVIYESARNILNEYRANAFSDANNDTDRFSRCDLLIIDDLGAEPKGEFAAAAFTDIVDSRLLAKKNTIISTNLTASELVRGYSQRFASRVLSCYTLLTFIGRDVRMLKMTGEK